MIIENGDFPFVSFDQILNGFCFIFEKEVYMKMETILATNGIRYNAVRLADGEPCHFLTSYKTRVVNAKVVIE